VVRNGRAAVLQWSGKGNVPPARSWPSRLPYSASTGAREGGGMCYNDIMKIVKRVGSGIVVCVLLAKKPDLPFDPPHLDLKTPVRDVVTVYVVSAASPTASALPWIG